MLLKKRISKLPLLIIVLFFILIIIVSSHNVSTKVSLEDEYYIKLFLKNIEPLPQNAKYQNELEFIRRVQSALLDQISYGKDIPGIPYNHTREPKDLLKIKQGACYDISRFLEKTFSYYDFKTRHVAIFSLDNNESKISALLKPQIYSHAFTEVLTQKGWMIVDSKKKWIGLNKDSLPVSMKIINSNNLIWLNQAPEFDNISLDKGKKMVIYGLFSRHGRLYPPYNFIPDYNLHELLYNIL